MKHLNSAVDRILARVEHLAIGRWHILALLFLGVGLLTQGHNQAFELIGGNYTNVISATVSLLVLAEQKASEARQAGRHEDLKEHVTAAISQDEEGSS